MEHIRHLVISNKEPKDIYVGWLKPEPNGKYLLYFYNRGEWVNLLEHLESKQVINHLNKTFTLAGVVSPESVPENSIFPVFYIAKQAGIYSYFDGIEIKNPSILYKINNTWESIEISKGSSLDISDISDNSISGSKIKDNTIVENKLSLELQEKINDKPIIPTVNNATITILKNGETVDSFTSNQASAKTINITVPTTAADVSALPASTKYGYYFDLSIDSKTYIVSLIMKDQDGNAIGETKTIDLPLESVVVNGSYDNTKLKIVLTLKSGSTIDVPVGDLVVGLQTEITSTNKLSADLITDGTINKTVTESEKNKWNNLKTISENSVSLTELNSNILPYSKEETVLLQPFNAARLRTKFYRTFREYKSEGEVYGDFSKLYIEIKAENRNGSPYPNTITANLLRYIKKRRLSARMNEHNGSYRTGRIHSNAYNNWVKPKLKNTETSDTNVTTVNTIVMNKNTCNGSTFYEIDTEVLKLFIILYLKEEEHNIPYYTAYNTTLNTSINITPYIETIEILGINYPVNRVLKYNPKKIKITSLDSSDWVGTGNVIGVLEVEERSITNIYGDSCCKLKLLNAKLGVFNFNKLDNSYSTDTFNIYIYIDYKAPDFFKESYLYLLVYSSEGYSASKTASNYNITNLISYCNKKQLVLLGFPMFKWGKTPIKPILKNGVFMYEFTIGIQHNIFGLVPIKALLYYNEKTNKMCFRFKNSSKYSTCSIYPY